jgi:hypothetical protein
LTYEALEELRDTMRRPPWLLEPVNIWRAYKRLDDTRVRGNSTRILTDIVMLVRYALGDSVRQSYEVRERSYAHLAHRRAIHGCFSSVPVSRSQIDFSPILQRRLCIDNLQLR